LRTLVGPQHLSAFEPGRARVRDELVVLPEVAADASGYGAAGVPFISGAVV
jgi:hypothetical protein